MKKGEKTSKKVLTEKERRGIITKLSRERRQRKRNGQYSTLKNEQ